MSKIRTVLSSVLPKVTTPVVLGAMAGASGGELAGAVSRAGGFGFIGAGYYTPEMVQAETLKAYKQLGISDRNALVQSKARAGFGIGLLTWRLTELDEGRMPPTSAQEPLPPASSSKAMALIDSLVMARPQAVWLSFGNEQELLGWKDCIQRRDRELNPDLAETAGERIKYFIMIGRKEELRFAVEDMAADVLVVQGEFYPYVGMRVER